MTKPYVLRFLVASINWLHRTLEKVRDAHQDEVHKNLGRILALQIANLNHERDSHQAEKIASKLRVLLED